jgi:hypothetical protein
VSVISLWPLLIIAVGLEVLGKSVDSEWLRVVSSLVVLGGLLVGALFLPTTDASWFRVLGSPGSAAEDIEFVAEHDTDVEFGFAEIRAGAGDIEVAAGDELVEAYGRTPFRDPEFEADIEDETADVLIDIGEGPTPGRSADLEVLLDEDVVWELEIDTGASALDVDLSDLEVAELLLDSGASDIEITFGDLSRHAVADINTGVSSLTLRVPEGLGVEVEVRSGIAPADVDRALRRVEGSDARMWRTEDYDRASRTLDITVEAGISSLDVIVY